MHSFCVVVTRPTEDAIKTSEILGEYQIKSFIEPVLKITLKQDSSTATEIENIRDAIILTTSVNAIRALKKISDRRDFSIITVGKSTQQIAKDIGFSNVILGGNNVDELEEFVLENYSNKEFIYLSSNIVTKDLKQTLQHKGFNISQLEIYKSEYVDNFSNKYIQKLKNNEFGAVLLYSLRSAQSFLNLTQKNNLQKHTSNINIFCLSENIREYLIRSGLNKNIIKSQYLTNENLIKSVKDFLDDKQKKTSN